MCWPERQQRTTRRYAQPRNERTERRFPASRPFQLPRAQPRRIPCFLMAVKLGTEAVTGNTHPLIGSQFGHIMLAKLNKQLDYPARAPSYSSTAPSATATGRNGHCVRQGASSRNNRITVVRYRPFHPFHSVQYIKLSLYSCTYTVHHTCIVRYLYGNALPHVRCRGVHSHTFIPSLSFAPAQH